MKRGRPPLKGNEGSGAKREVIETQMDFLKLGQCYQLVTRDASESIEIVQASYPVKQRPKYLLSLVVIAEAHAKSKNENVARHELSRCVAEMCFALSCNHTVEGNTRAESCG